MLKPCGQIENSNNENEAVSFNLYFSVSFKEQKNDKSVVSDFIHRGKFTLGFTLFNE